MKGWTLEEAVALCRAVEDVCPAHYAHVALTGGALYKDGERKDVDLVFYRVRQADRIDAAGLFEALQHIGLEITKHYGWCHKGTYQGRDVDVFFPEALEDWTQDCGDGFDTYQG